MTLLRTAVETEISGVHKLLHTGEVPALTVLVWRWLAVSSVFAGRSAWASYSHYPLPPRPFFPSLISLMVSVDEKHRERRSCVAGSSRGRPLPTPSPPLFPSLISLMVSVDGKYRERLPLLLPATQILLSRCFPSTETIRLIRDGKGGGEGAGSVNSSGSNHQEVTRIWIRENITVLSQHTLITMQSNLSSHRTLFGRFYIALFSSLKQIGCSPRVFRSCWVILFP